MFLNLKKTFNFIYWSFVAYLWNVKEKHVSVDLLVYSTERLTSMIETLLVRAPLCTLSHLHLQAILCIQKRYIFQNYLHRVFDEFCKL